MRVLVTGAAGYLGCRLVQRLAAVGAEVLAVDRFYFGRDGIPQHANIRWIDADARDVAALPVDRVDAVISLAAYSSERAAATFPDEAWSVNVTARGALAARARRCGVRRFVLPSSSNVYGTSVRPLDESARPAPRSVYGKTCLAAEEAVRREAAAGFEVIVLRQATLHGWSPKMRFDLVVNNLARLAAAGEPLPVAGDGRQRRPFAHIDDVVSAHVHALRAPAGAVAATVFNVGTAGDNVRINDVVASVRSLAGPLPVSYYGPLDTLSHALSYRAVRGALGWRPSRTIADSVTTITAMLAAHPELATDPRTDRADWLSTSGIPR
jgi:nucleoside-diphosphate-sugar epimerase